ncbi:MAG: hypothetical protein R3C53_10790 [Pirellulaceae bacterium]
MILDSQSKPFTPRDSVRVCLCLFFMAQFGVAQQPDSLRPNRLDTPTVRVSPVLEIEVLDPNADPRGNPAVTVTTDAAGNSQVEIPPSLIVHRYYYTGDRSFRGPDLPGGPSIVIAQNPRDGQQVYLQVQMLPGSPIVHYTDRSIEYDFGNRAVIVSFPRVGEPTVSYRNGRPWAERAGSLFGLEKLNTAWDNTKSNLSTMKFKTQSVGQTASVVGAGLIRPLTLPAQNLARLLPGHAALTDPNLELQLAEQSALNARQREIEQAAARNRLNELDLPR